MALVAATIVLTGPAACMVAGDMDVDMGCAQPDVITTVAGAIKRPVK